MEHGSMFASFEKPREQPTSLQLSETVRRYADELGMDVDEVANDLLNDATTPGVIGSLERLPILPRFPALRAP